MDSGTTSHMSRSMEGMKIIKKIDSEIGVANESMKTKTIGSIEFE